MGLPKNPHGCSVDNCGGSFYAKGYCEKHYNRWRTWGDPHKVKKPDQRPNSNANPERAKRRLLAKIVKDEAGCWVWQGTKTVGGYGTMVVLQRSRYTHRLSYEMHVGPIAEGLVIDHLCRNRACCNPDHLEPVTDAENLRRGIGHGSETHCPKGHPYSGDNLIVRKDNGHRACRACQTAYNKIRWQREKARRDA